MKILFLILLSSSCFGQWAAKWKRLGASDTLQSSSDRLTWNIVGILKTALDSNSMAIVGPTYYYRVNSGKISTNTVLVTQVLPVTIIGWGITPSTKYVIVYWTSTNENNLKSYEIDRSYDGVNFTLQSLFSPKGNSLYQITINRPTTTTTTCINKWWGICWKKQTIITVDSRRGIYQIISIDYDGIRTVLKTIAE